MTDSSACSSGRPPSGAGKVRFVARKKSRDNEDHSDSDDDREHDHDRVAMLPSYPLSASLLPDPPSQPLRGSTLGTPPLLAHLQNHWPGTTGNGHHLEVRPMSFHDLLSSGDYRIVIPLFQRRYCWTPLQIQQWYRDLIKINVGQHSTHKTMFKKHYDADTNNLNLICIDGQQRTTTVTLFLMALRAQARRSETCSSLVGAIDGILFQHSDGLAGMKRWAKYQAFQLFRNHQTTDEATEIAFPMPHFETGWFPPFETMLIPSYIDRAAYYEILCHDYIQEALEQLLTNTSRTIKLKFGSNCQESAQYKAFTSFATELATITSGSALKRLFRTQLHSFSIMYIELLTDDNLQQIFLWMQEKTVFGMGRLLNNPHPGIDFTPIDLARNLVVSCVMDKPLPQQMDFFQKCWVEPLEVRFGSPSNLSKILHHMVGRMDLEATNVSSSPPRFVGDMELKLQQYKAGVPPPLQAQFGSDQPMMIYARFHTLVQHRALKLCGDPNAITQQVAESIVQDLVQEGEMMTLK